MSEPLLYKNGVVKYKGKVLKDSRLLGLRGSWMNDLGYSYKDHWLIVFDDYIILGDQVKEHHSLHRLELIDKMSGVEFLGTTYNTISDVSKVDVKITVNGVEWDHDILKEQIKNRLHHNIRSLLEN